MRRMLHGAFSRRFAEKTNEKIKKQLMRVGVMHFMKEYSLTENLGDFNPDQKHTLFQSNSKTSFRTAGDSR